MTISVQLDPNNAYPNASSEDLANSLGFLLPWAMNCEQYGNSVADALEKQYMYFDQWRHIQGKLSDSLTWQYPGDPPLEPIAVFRNPDQNEIVIIYPHAMVIKCHSDMSNAQVTRMD